MAFELHNTLRTRTPVSSKTGVLWSKAADQVLGKAYDVSAVLIGNAKSHRLNTTYRGKDKPTNVLAFPISDSAGEIFINVPYSLKEAPKYASEHDPKLHLTFLFLHGLLHLKGMDHGPAMEAAERRLLKKFGR